MSLLNNRRRIIMSASQASYEHDVEGSFPLTFNSNGKSLSLYELEGTTSQNGTPGTAQVRTNQLFNKDSKDINNGYMANMVFDSEGVPTESSIEDSYDISEYIDITGFNYVAFNAEATSLNGIFVVMYTANKDYLGGYDASVVRTMGHIPIVGPAPKYIRFVINKSSADTIMVNSGETSLPYEPYYKTVIIPVPVNGTGDKTGNLLPLSTQHLIKGETYYGVTVEDISDGVVRFSGISTDNIVIVVMNEAQPVGQVGEKHFLQGVENGSSDTYYMQSQNGFRDTGNGCVISSEDDLKTIRLYVKSGTNMNGVVIKPMISVGTSKKDFEPFGYKIPILCSGKNICKPPTFGKSLDMNTGEEIQSNGGCITEYISVNDDFVITVSGFSEEVRIMIFGYDSQKKFIRRSTTITSKTSRTFSKATLNAKVIDITVEIRYIRIAFTKKSSSPIDVLPTDPMMEYGNTVTSYEPYTDRQLYSGDKISYPENLRTNKTGVLVLTGNENWESYTGATRFRLNIQNAKNSGYNILCTHIQANISSLPRILIQNTFLIVYRDGYEVEGFRTIDEFKEFLASEYNKGTPVTVYYELAEPTTETIELPEISTLKGYNVMSVQTEVQPSHGYVRFSNNIPRVKMDDYLYDTSYSKLNYTWAKEFLRLRYSNRLGECSTVYKDGLFGRNYDWNYNESVYFFTKISKSKTVKYSSKGICGGFSELTKSFVESGKSSELYRALPYVMLDGINECGVVASVNVVSNDYGTTTGTVPTEYTEETLSTMMLVRYILDNFATAAEAVDYIEKYVSIHSPNGATSQLPFALLENTFDQEVHIMVADKTSAYVLEFVENELKVIRDKNYMTNFHLYNTSVDSSGHIDASTVAPYGTGLERYNIIADNYASVNSVSTMTDLMLKLNFTNAYKSTTNPVWKTEFAGTTPERTVTADISVYQDIINSARAAFIVRSRNGTLWQTVHTTVYDTNTGEMYIITQESGKDKQIRRL